MRWLAAALCVTGCHLVFELEDRPLNPVDAAEPVEPVLVASYPFDTSPVTDTTGGHHGMCTNPQCPTLEAGHIGSAARFDGVDDRIEIASAADFDTAAGFTVTFWMRLDILDGCPVNKVYEQAIGDTWQVCVAGQDVAFFSTGGVARSLVPLATGEWHHVAIRWDAISTTQYLSIGGRDVAAGLATIVDDDRPIVFGADINNGSTEDWMTGLLDEVRIYKGTLTQADIAALAEN